jgi:pilus assembly protein Flp/PilA
MTGMETHDMEHIRLILARLTNDKRAVTALEYGMIAALIAVVVVSGFTALGTKLSSTLSTISNAL